MTAVPFSQFYRQPYLKVQWLFPNTDLKDMSAQMDKAYIDIASKVNDRVIGIYPERKIVPTGSKWYLNGYTRALQTFREVIVFPAMASGTFLNIDTGVPNLISFTSINGVAALDTGTDWRPLPYVDPSLLTTSMTVLVEPNPSGGNQSVKVVLGATAPNISAAYVTIEWLSSV
jgi:hypothetical protein